MPKAFRHRRAIRRCTNWIAFGAANIASASGTQATEKHEFLQQRFPHTQRAAWETVWIPQFALLGDEQDMSEIAEAIGKIRRHAPAIAANTSQATAGRVAR